MTVSLLAAGYAWNVAEGAGGEASGYYAIAVVFGAAFGFFVWSVVSGKYWAMAYDLREIHQASWGEAVFTAGDANKRILDALLGAKEGGENILISVYTDTKRRARRQLWGVWTLASGFISIAFEKIATL